MVDMDVNEFAVPEVRWSIVVSNPVTGELVWSLAPDLVLQTASVGKLFLLIEVARQLDAGTLDPAELLTRTADDFVADSGVWHTLQAESLSIVDACALVGAVSDNLATNVLLRRVGLDAVTSMTRSLGFSRSALLDRVRDERRPEHPPTLSRGSAVELAQLVGRLHTGDVVSRPVSDQVLAWMMLNTDLSMVASAFGFDPLAHAGTDRGSRLWNKTGTDSTVRADVGIIEAAAGTYAYAVLANWSESESADGDPRDAVLQRMRLVGHRLRAHLERAELVQPASPR